MDMCVYIYIYIYIYICIYIYTYRERDVYLVYPEETRSRRPNLHIKVLPAKIRRLDISGKSPMDMIIPPLEIKILPILRSS